MDGRSVYTPLFAGVYWQVQDTLLEDIERIEVIRGPGGTIWGANAVNAVINIITKHTKQTHGMLASVGGGTVDQGFVNFRYGAGNGESFNYRIYGKAFTRGPQFHFIGSPFDDWRMGQTGFRTDWALHNRDEFSLQGDLYKGYAGQKIGLASYSPPFMTSLEQNAGLAGGNLLGHWKRALGAGSNIQVQTYYDRTSREQVNFAESRDTFDIDLIHTLPLPLRQKFLWGVGTRLSSGNVTQVVPTVVFTPNHHTEKLYSAFIQDEIPLIADRLALTIGSKFLHNNYSGFEFEPSARVLWTPTSKQTVWGAVTRAVRTPSRIEEDLQISALLAPAPLTFFRLSGDRQFASESLIGYEAGYRGLIRPTLYVDVAFFHNNYDHLLSVEPGTPFSETTPPPAHFVLPFVFRNGLFGNTSGFEIAPDWAPTRWWHLRGSYSYLHIDLSNKAGSLDFASAGSVEGSSPQHQGTIQFSLNLPKKMELDQTVRFVSALPAQLVPAYTTADVRFNWHATHSLDVSVVGQNLLQPRHSEFGGDPGGLVGIKRSVYLKVTWQTSEKVTWQTLEK
jgi:iron complex outermembrane receptor protein